ncbi:MAG TPA: M81 family metallopeptidase [Dongiaceae bacterium]|jgi:microcystin degradation protein MlrC
MKLFIAGFDTETNTFAPIPTGIRGFEEGFMAHGDATRQEANYHSVQLHVWRKLAEARNWQVVESLSTYAEPGGTIVRSVYERLRDEILADLKKAMPVDVVLLALHGAMVAEGYDDCEGDLIAKVRAIVGPDVIVGAELDLHCHVSDMMVREANLLVAYKEYPHVDIHIRADELFKLAADAAMGKTKPTMAAFDCRMINTYRTTEQPLRGFVDKMMAMEGKNGVLSVSLSHCFPWADVPDIGAKTIVITDGDPSKATALAADLGKEFFGLRHKIAPKFLLLDEALEEALALEGKPIVIADVADNAGGGAPGDNTAFLRRVLERGIRDVASGFYWDPMAVKFCQEAGVGATFNLRLGGKMGPTSSMPLDIRVTVRALADSVTQRFGDAPVNLGASAWITTEGVDLVVNSLRTQVFHPEGFTKLGIDLSQRKIVVVKSTQHFHAGFAPIAKKILYAATADSWHRSFGSIPYTKLKRPYWPKVEDPFAA